MTDIEARLAKALDGAAAALGQSQDTEDGVCLGKEALAQGKLQTLKVPDPEFVVKRLTAGQSAGLLARRSRVARLGDAQALVSGRGAAARVWGVVSQGGPVPAASLAALDGGLRSGVDKATRADYAEQDRELFYIPLRLLAQFDPPLKLRRAPLGKRFGSTIDFATDIELDAPPAAWFAENPSAERLRGLSDESLATLRGELCDLHDSDTVAVEKADIVNAHAFVLAEANHRTLDLDMNVEEPFLLETLATLSVAAQGGNLDAFEVVKRFATVHPSGKAAHADDPVLLDEVLSALDKSMALRTPAVFLVGGVAQHGMSPNDVDLLVRGPFDEATEHVIKVRLGRALPPRLSQRVQFVKDDMGGPISTHVPLFDLVLVPHSARELVQMRTSDGFEYSGAGGCDVCGHGTVADADTFDPEAPCPECGVTMQVSKQAPREGMSGEQLDAARKARSRQFGIEVLDAGSALSFPAGFPTDLRQYGDPVNLKYPVDTVERARNARTRFKQNADAYQEARSRARVHERIVRAELRFGVVPSFDSDDPLDKLLPAGLRDQLSKSVEKNVRLLKQDSTADTGGAKEERFVFGVVLVPDEVDAQGEVYSADEVRKAAHSFMELFGGQFKVMHKGRPVDGVQVLETYVTKAKEAHGGETFPMGTWLMGVRVQDDELWADVQAGEFTGFSIGGTALRERLT